MIAVRLIGVLVLVALNGFFAAAEFSLVAVRLSRVRQLVQKGNARDAYGDILWVLVNSSEFTLNH